MNNTNINTISSVNSKAAVETKPDTGPESSLASENGHNSIVAENAENKSDAACSVDQKQIQPKEFNGPKGLEPTRYGDWESKGRCYDF